MCRSSHASNLIALALVTNPVVLHSHLVFSFLSDLLLYFSLCRCEHVYVSAQLQIHVNENLYMPFLSDIDHDGSYPQSHSGDDLLSTTEVDVYIYIYVYCLMCV